MNNWTATSVTGFERSVHHNVSLKQTIIRLVCTHRKRNFMEIIAQRQHERWTATNKLWESRASESL